MMDLILKIHLGTGEEQSYSLKDEGPCDSIPVIPYSQKRGTQRIQTLASAKLEGSFSDSSEYWLQLGGDPDTIARVGMGEAAEGVLSIPGLKRADFKWKGKRLFPLFQSTFGRTHLRLFEMAYDEDGAITIVREVMSFPIYITPPEEKKIRYVKMIDDLRDTPQFFLDDFKGQMLLNCFSTHWDDGYSSYDDASMELDAVERVLEALRKPLEDMCKAPKTKYALCRRRIDIDRVGRCSTHDERRVELSRDRGTSVQRATVLEKCVSYEVNSHSVVRHFFYRLAWRCDDILLEFSALRKKLESEIKSLKDLYGGDERDPAYAPRVHEKQQQIEILMGKVSRGNSARSRALICASCWLLRDAKRPLVIFDIPRTAFTGSVGYEQAYEIMLDFERRRFWWVGSNSKFYKTPNLSFVNEPERESRWVRKYSIVYEFWCYQRMLKAFGALGFVCVGGECLSADEGSRCLFRRKELEIELVHGFSARNNLRENQTAEFWLDPSSCNGSECGRMTEDARERTPDFAIVFKNLNTRKTKWIVADAKSHERMSFKQIIRKRELYLRFVKHRVSEDAAGSEDAAQSWIFYAGEEERSPCGVECPPLHSKSLGDERDVHAGVRGYTFSPVDGIVRTGEGDLPRGHVHANIETLGTNNSPFEDFISGEAATMTRELL